MNLTCVGISHNTAPLDVREQLWFSSNEVRQALPHLKELGCSEGVLFSTCNRTEIYVVAENSQLSPDILKNFLIEQKNAVGKVQTNDMFSLNAGDAARHLFRVASGIDSMVLGDVQILMQVKDGFNLATEFETSGFFMNRLFQFAFRVGKRARSETNIGEGAVSVSYAAVELAEKIFENLQQKTALIIGAGETAELTATHLQGKKIGKLFIANRTYEHAERLALKMQATAVPFTKLFETIAESDIILSSVSTEQFIIQSSNLENLGRKRTYGPICVIDLGVPRNVDPKIKEIENIFLYDIDTLQTMVDENLHRRKTQIPKVEIIIDEVLNELAQWYSSLEVNPTISALAQFMEKIRQEEVTKNINRFEHKDQELVELVTKRIVNKILHAPITNLKNGQKESLSNRLQRMHTIQKLFGLVKSTKDSADEI